MQTWENYKTGLETKISDFTSFNNNLENAIKLSPEPLTEIESGDMRDKLVKGYGMLTDWSTYIKNEPEFDAQEDYKRFYRNCPLLIKKYRVQQQRFCSLSIKTYKKLMKEDRITVDKRAKEYVKILSDIK